MKMGKSKWDIDIGAVHIIVEAINILDAINQAKKKLEKTEELTIDNIWGVTIIN